MRRCFEAEPETLLEPKTLDAAVTQNLWLGSTQHGPFAILAAGAGRGRLCVIVSASHAFPPCGR